MRFSMNRNNNPNTNSNCNALIVPGVFRVDEAVEVDTGFDSAKDKQQVLAPSGKEMLEFLSGPALPRDKEV